jgi:ubiquinone/menaquinone biosynthesis C-methylase UbiE
LTTPGTLCDYEGHDYRTRFWGQGREYEDRAERIALRRLLPPHGQRLAEIGAGFGRLADLYDGYQQVILLDPARSLLLEARETLRDDDRFLFVRGDANNLPLADQACDTLVMVRVMHHLPEVGRAMSELARSLCRGGTLVYEYANKRNLKAVVRYLVRRQPWSPFVPEPVEFAPMHFDFHPAWMAERLREAGFESQRDLAVSTFRLALLKRLVPPRLLATLDGLLQPLGGFCKLSPSVFVRATRSPVTNGAPSSLPANPFRCPACHAAPLAADRETLICRSCDRRWPITDGIYDFGEPQRGQH